MFPSPLPSSAPARRAVAPVRWVVGWLVAFGCVLPGVAPAQDVYQQPGAFIDEAFAGQPPSPAKLWVRGQLRDEIRDILQRDLKSLRLRYWKREGRSAWILEEIGKDKPITTGLVVNRGAIERLKVLIFREIRGWEVKYPFFTDQFTGVELTAERELDRDIDGITGATLSVNALKRLARLALFLDQHTNEILHAQR